MKRTSPLKPSGRSAPRVEVQEAVDVLEKRPSRKQYDEAAAAATAVAAAANREDERRSELSSEVFEEGEEVVFSPPPSTGPHTLISHLALRYFWGVFLVPSEVVKKSVFVAKLLFYLSSPRPPPAERRHPFPFPPCGYGLGEGEISALQRGQPRSLLDGILLALDLDGTGLISTMQVDRATRSIPSSTPLRESLYLLAHQRGKIVLPPCYFIESNEQLLINVRNDASMTVGAHGSGKAAAAGGGGGGSNRGGNEHGSTSPVAFDDVFFSPFAVGAKEVVGDVETQGKIEANMGNVGWSVVSGKSGSGKTMRVLCACRARLHKMKILDPFSSTSVSASVSVSEEALSPLNTPASTPSVGTLHGLDAVYVDLRGTSSKVEVINAFAFQIGLCGFALLELETYLYKFLRLLKQGSILIMDHVDGDICAILTSLLDPFASRLALVVVSGGRGESAASGIGNAETAAAAAVVAAVSASTTAAASAALKRHDENLELSEIIDELGTRLAAPFQISVVFVQFLSNQDAAVLAEKFLKDSWRRKKQQIPSQAETQTQAQNAQVRVLERSVEIITALAGGSASTIRVLSGFDFNLLTSLSSSLLSISDRLSSTINALAAAAAENNSSGGGASAQSPFSTQPTSAVTAAQIFYHDGVLEGDERLAIACLWPLRFLQGASFDEETAWALTSKAFSKPSFTTLRNVRVADTRSSMERWHYVWKRLLEVGWMESRPYGQFAFSTLACSCPPPAPLIAVQSTVSMQTVSSKASTEGSDSSNVHPSARQQWELYFHFWTQETIRLNALLRSAAEAADSQSVRSGSGAEVEERGGGGGGVGGAKGHRVAGRQQTFALLDAKFAHLHRLLSLWFEVEEGEELETSVAIDGVRGVGVGGGGGGGKSGGSGDVLGVEVGFLNTSIDDKGLGEAGEGANNVNMKSPDRRSMIAISKEPPSTPTASSSSSSTALEESLSPKRRNSNDFLSLSVTESVDQLDLSSMGIPRSRSEELILRDRELLLMKEKERETRKRKRAERRRRHARDELEAIAPSDAVNLSLSLAGNVGAICTHRLDKKQSIALSRSIARSYLAVYGPNKDTSPEFVAALNELGSMLLASGEPAEMQEARNLLKEVVSTSEAISAVRNDPLLHLQSLFNYGRAMLGLEVDVVGGGAGVEQIKVAEGGAAEELGKMVLEQVLFKIRVLEQQHQEVLLLTTTPSPSVAVTKYTRLFANTLALLAEGHSRELQAEWARLSSNRSSSTRGGTGGGGLDAGFASEQQQQAFENRVEHTYALFEEAKQTYVLLGGERCFRAGEIMTSIGSLLAGCGRSDQAKPFFEQALKLFKRRAEGPHIRTAHALAGLAKVVSKERGRDGLARLLFEETLNMYKSVLADDNPLVTGTANTLGTLLTLQMRYDRAIVLYEEALVCARRASLHQHTSSVGSMITTGGGGSTLAEMEREKAAVPPILVTLAALHDKTEQYHLALPLFQEAILLFREIAGANSTAVAETLLLLAESTNREALARKDQAAAQGTVSADGLELCEERYEEAIRLANEALDIFRDLNGVNSHSVVRTLRCKISIHQSHKNYALAKLCFEQVLEIYHRTRIGVVEELAESQASFGDLLRLNNEQMEAMIFYQQSIIIYRKLFGDTSRKVAEVLVSMAQAMIDEEMFEDAQPVIEEAMSIFLRVAGSESPQMAECFHCLGAIFQALEENDEAKQAYRMAYTIFIKNYGEMHPHVARAANNIATLLDDEGELEEATRLYDEALNILRKVHGDHHPQVLLSMENMVCVIDGRGLHDQAQALEKMLDDIVSKIIEQNNAEERVHKSRPVNSEREKVTRFSPSAPSSAPFAPPASLFSSPFDGAVAATRPILAAALISANRHAESSPRQFIPYPQEAHAQAHAHEAIVSSDRQQQQQQHEMRSGRSDSFAFEDEGPPPLAYDDQDRTSTRQQERACTLS